MSNKSPRPRASLLLSAENKKFMLQWVMTGKRGRLRNERTPPGLTNPGFYCDMLIAGQIFCVNSVNPSCLVSAVPAGGGVMWGMFSCIDASFVHHSVPKFCC